LDLDSLFVACGILGATVMPHNFFLHSSAVQSRNYQNTQKAIRQAFFYNFIDTAIALNFAFFVNLSILIVSAAVFFVRGQQVTELQDAHDLLGVLLNSKAAPVFFGLGLVCAGQSSTVTGTMAGQIVMEGFLEFQMVPWLRRLVTRLVAIVPAAIVVAIAGSEGTYTLLLISQVILSLALPFAMIPLIQFTSSPNVVGMYTNPKWLTALSWTFALLIIGLNMWLVESFVADLMVASRTAMFLTSFLILPLVLGMLGLAGYLSLFWKSKSVDMYLQPVEENGAEEEGPELETVPSHSIE